MMQTDLGGHSGCKVILHEPDDAPVFVRKISISKEYNHRLQIQAAKQKKFVGNKILTPKVLAEGYTTQGLYFFDMEYIQGITLSEYIKSLEVSKIRGLVDDIVTNIVKIEDKGVSDESLFINKINDLNIKLLPLNNAVINTAMEILLSHNWNNIEKSCCHGDMTLENIIVKDGQLYLIDFLDSFYDSWVLDVSTILQDVQTMWSYRYEKEISVNTSIRLIIFRDILIEEVKRNVGNRYIEVYYTLLLKLIRIYPYTTDTLTYEFLNKKILDVIEIIKKSKC